MLVDVWGRPLFTWLYLIPARFGYPVAKLATVAVCIAAAWQMWRVAQRLGFARPELAIPLLFLQPSFLRLAPETMTEPLFALVFVTALRLHLEGRVTAGAAVASLMPLARPEGFFVSALWGLWILFGERDRARWWRRMPAIVLLAAGCALWWLAAYLVSGDPLFIKHSWPGNWAGNGFYGKGSFWDYWGERAQILGPLLWWPFMVGLAVLLARRRAMLPVAAVLFLFVVHSTLWARGLFGSAGYSRYFVCVSPAMALITLAGWNAFADLIARALSVWYEPRLVRATVVVASAAVLLAAGRDAVMYVDGMPWSRDAWAVRESYEWFRAHPRPVRQLVWSQAYMAILFDWDPWRGLGLTADRERNLAALRAAPPGTLVFWDADTGPDWYTLRAADFEAAGYQRLRSTRWVLRGLIPVQAWGHDTAARTQEIQLFYR